MLRYEVVPAAQAADPRLREQLLDTWVRVTDAGGAVGFTAPAVPAEIAETLDASLERVVAGHDVLGILRSDGTAAGMGLLVESRSVLRRHWRTLLRLMVAPELQGQGAGRLLLEGLQATATGMGLEHLVLTVRGGTGLEGFYGHLGYEIIGRHPAAIRLRPGDDREEIIMRRRL